MVTILLRIIERRQMLFMGVAASLFTWVTLAAPDLLRPGKAVIELPLYAKQMKVSEIADRDATRRGIIRCGYDPAWSMVAVINSTEFNRRLSPFEKGQRVSARIGKVSGQVEISGHGGSLSENATLANHAATEYLRFSREGQHRGRELTRQLLLSQRKKAERRLQALAPGPRHSVPVSGIRNAEIAQLNADVAEYREKLRLLGEHHPTNNEPRIVAWAGYRSPFLGPWIVFAWGLLCAGIGAGAASLADWRTLKAR